MLPWMRRLSARFLSHEVPAPSGPLLLDAYLLLARRPGGAEPLDTRLELLVGQLSAELSGCRWCIEAGRHRWRKALLPIESLKLLHTPGDAECFSERDRAALAFAARRHFREREIVRLTILAAGEHFGDCLGARLGTDARQSFLIAVRGLS